MSNHTPTLINLTQLQQDIASLPPDAQQVIFDLVNLLKTQNTTLENSVKIQDSMAEWSDFIGCGEAASDLSRNYKTYLAEDLETKYSNH